MPETTGYLILALIMVAVIMLNLIGLMFLRANNLRRDEAALRDLEQSDNQP